MNKVIARKNINDGLRIEEQNIWREIQEVANAK
jgi:hypothetical protein